MANSIYNPITLEVGNVLKDVITGKIGLPDLQRPFVWKNDKVRDLLDSMLRGYPIGYVMLWEPPADDASKKSQIGDNEKAYAVPKELVIDGQQRLTALLAVFYGVEVRDSTFKSRPIRIAYNPITAEFKVADASTDRDPRFVSCVSDVFGANRENGFSSYRRAFIRALNESNVKKGEPELDDPAEDAIERGLTALLGLERYLLPVLRITADADEETVSDIFVRVNSQGQALRQDDFIMTLLSVYEPAMRERIERFCADSRVPMGGTSYNQLIAVSPTSVIRTAVAVGFKRGRLRYAYQILRGKDLKTKETSARTRAENFERFGTALDQVLDLNNWHSFINLLGEAGYVAPSQISSANALFFTYAFYLIGKREFGIGHGEISRLIRRWFFACSITSYYVGGFETAFERQLTEISQLGDASDFQEYFERAVASLLTDDYFTITLPNDLDANDAVGPTWNGFVAAQVVLGCKSLFGTTPLSQLLLPSASGTKKALDKHHLFPDNYLKSIGRKEKRSARANFALVDYGTNIEISDDSPLDYVPRFKQRLGYEAYERTCEEHALPVEFEGLDYDCFLYRRRILMAELIRKGFERL